MYNPTYGGKTMRKIIINCILISLVCMLLAGCSKDEPATNIENTGFVEAVPGSFDSMDTAVLVSKNDDQTLTFMNIETGKNYTLSYTGATTMWDKYGEAISMAQLSEGDIVDVKFLREKKKVADSKSILAEIQGMFQGDTGWNDEESMIADMAAFRKERMGL